MRRLIKLAWLRWCRDVAVEELKLFQLSSVVGSAYLVNTMTHINTLERRIAELE